MSTKGSAFTRFFLLVLVVLGACASGFSASVSTHALTSKPKNQSVSESTHAKKHMRRLARSRPRAATTKTARSARIVRTTRRHHRRYYERFLASSFVTGDIAEGDVTTGEDPVVRQAAIDALGNMNGTVLAIEPTSGRVLAMVNQKLALSSGAQPCSTIKLSVALAALSEGLVSKET